MLFIFIYVDTARSVKAVEDNYEEFQGPLWQSSCHWRFWYNV